jgi:class 3 adenylate cyclase/tetratricopeptide (TPR) repeat protein
MRCPNCQTINPANAKFCLECGNRLIVCPNCGTVNLPIAKFCIECGTPLRPRGESTVPLPQVSGTGSSTSNRGNTSNTTGNRNGTTQSEILLPSEERRVVTVMFADITGSTPLADRLDPEDMRAILTGYFNLMTEQIRKHGGTVEKYIGDAVMAIFGVPITHEDDPDRAVRAALDMQTALTRFNEQRQAQDPEATRLQMRIGINTGEVAIPSNVQQRQDFLITGDAVNIAARLQQVATPDTILIGERTYLSTREVFEFRPIAPLRLKGKPEPIAASVVLGLRRRTPAITQHPRGIEGRQAELIGRSLELTLLHANYARVQAERHPHLITILGAPGIGKSRLVREFIAREQQKVQNASSNSRLIEPRVLQGRCPPYGESITYWPLIEILRSLLHVQENESNEALQQRFTEFVKDTLDQAMRTEAPEEITSTILRSIGRGLSGRLVSADRDGLRRDHQPAAHGMSGTQVALLRAWRVLLESLAQVQPLIIVVDDLQWADEALLDLLEYLTDRITTVPILFLCPARPDFFERRRDWGGGRRNFTTIELEALSREESSELVDELLNTDDLPEVLRNTILTRAEGNPFFVEEIVRMFIDQGVLVCDENHEHGVACWRVGPQNEAQLSELITPGERPEDTLINMHYVLPLPRVPDTIQGVLAARIDLLNPTEKLVLQHAAIIGRTFWLSALLELAGDMRSETILDALSSLGQRDFIVEAERQIRSPIEHDRMFIFKHVLIRDVAYNNIPRVRRSQEHARIALWLEEQTVNARETYAELLSYHYQQALATWSPNFSMSAIEGRGAIYKPQDAPDPTALPVRLTRPELRRRAITYLIMAGDQALHSYYTTRALQAYNDAFELATESEADALTLIRLHEKLGIAHEQRGNFDEAWQEYRKALRLANEAGTEAESASLLPTPDLLCLYERPTEIAMRWLGRFDTPPDLHEVRTYIDAGLKLLEGQPLNRARVAFLTYQAFWYIRQLGTATYEQKANLIEQARASGQEALRMAEELNHPGALSLTLDAMSFIYDEYHNYNESHALQHRRLQLEHLLTDREELFDLYTALGFAHRHIAVYSTSLMWFGRAWNNAHTMESPVMLLGSMVGRMHSWRQWDRWENARQVALEILQLIEQYQQDEKRQFWALETLAVIAYWMGDQEQGDAYARQCRRLLDQQVERSGEESRPLLSTRMHAIHLAHEDWTRATADYKEKLRYSEPMPSPEVLATLAELLVMTGESAETQVSTCERALALAEASGDRKSLAIALRARGRMYTEQQNWQLAEDDLRQALQRCTVLDLPWERGNTLYHLGMLYKRRASTAANGTSGRRSADLSRARYHFEQALGFFESLKAQPGCERVRLALMQDTTARV